VPPVVVNAITAVPESSPKSCGSASSVALLCSPLWLQLQRRKQPILGHILR